MNINRLQLVLHFHTGNCCEADLVSRLWLLVQQQLKLFRLGASASVPYDAYNAYNLFA